MPEDVGYKNVRLPSGEVVAFPGNMSDGDINREIRRYLLGRMGEENARRLAPPPAPPAERSPGIPGPGFRVNRLSMGPGMSDPREVRAAAAGMAVPAAIAAIPAAPGAVGSALKFAATPTGGAIIGGAEGARRGGAHGALTGALAGAAAPGAIGRVAKILRFAARLRRAAPAASAAGSAAGTAARTVPAAVDDLAQHADEVIGQITRWKNTARLSDSQIVNALREQYGYAPKTARMMLKLVVGGE